ncbi:MAG TPA: hypothetical protein VD793_06075, partial [Gemmatimonadales bacterium]|nr:hypothetical protein [Gemmatimonadales bacterium]
MFEAIQSYLPLEWRRTVEFLGAPIWWIPDWQRTVMQFSLTGNTISDLALRWTFVLLPMTLVVVGVWATVVSLYTIPFRAQRGRFATTMAVLWWDAGRCIWFFWTGVVRLLVVLVGWLWGLVKLAAQLVLQAVKGAVQSPFVMLDWTSRRYFKPGVPWIAFLLTLG